MSKMKNIAAGLAVVPMFALSAPALAATLPGQIEAGNIYRVRNVSTSSNGAFAENANATCGETVQFRVRVHNAGPETLTNVTVMATLDGQKSTSHGSKVTVTADNNLNGAAVTAEAGVTTDKATTISYVAGSTELLGYSATAGQSPVLRSLPDGITTNGVNMGSVGPLTPDTESVQFKAKINCDTPPVTPPVTPPTTTTTSEKPSESAPAELVATGAGEVAAVFAAAAAFGAVVYNFVLRRQNAR